MKMVPNFAILEIEFRKTVLGENIKAFKKAVEEVQLESSKVLRALQRPRGFQPYYRASGPTSSCARTLRVLI